MSFLFYCFKTLSFCGCRDMIMNTVAFRPPTERKYELTLDRHDLLKGQIYTMTIKDVNSVYLAQNLEGLEYSVVWLETKTQKRIPALFIENQNCRTNFVILYSHGNSTDLGRMFKPLQELSQALNVHVFAYEYNGYGPTKGGVGEYEVIFGIMASYDFLTQRLGFKWQNIILYGRSIGSGPAIYLASHPNYLVSGIILHAPIASALRILKFDVKKTDSLDLFPNCDYIEHVKAHVFIIHGEADAEVPIAHSKLLASKAKNLFSPWWVPEGRHNDIDYSHRRAYFLRIAKFLKHVRDFNLSKSQQELDEFYKVAPWWHQFDHIYTRKVPEIEQNYKQLILKNDKKTLKDASCLSGSVLLTKRNDSYHDIKEQDTKDFAVDDKDIEEADIKGKNIVMLKKIMFEDAEARSYLPPDILGKSKKMEVEINSYSSSMVLKKVELSEGIKKSPLNPDKFSSVTSSNSQVADQEGMDIKNDKQDNLAKS